MNRQRVSRHNKTSSDSLGQYPFCDSGNLFGDFNFKDAIQGFHMKRLILGVSNQIKIIKQIKVKLSIFQVYEP